MFTEITTNIEDTLFTSNTDITTTIGDSNMLLAEINNNLNSVNNGVVLGANLLLMIIIILVVFMLSRLLGYIF